MVNKQQQNILGSISNQDQKPINEQNSMYAKLWKQKLYNL